MYQYPYGDSQQLNLDWIINKLIELEQSFVAGESAELEEFANALISLTYIPTQAYNNSDIVFHNGHLYRCNTTIPAPGEVWDPSHWDQIMLGNTVANLVRAVAGMNSDHVFNESNVNGDHVTEALNALVEDVRYNNHKIQQKKNGAYTDVIPVEDTPSNNSDRLASSKAAYDLKGAINDIENELEPITWDNVSLVDNAYVSNTDGSFVSYNGWQRTGYIAVDNDSTWMALTTKGSMYCAVYNANKTFVRALAVGTPLTELSFSSNEKFIALSFAGLTNTVKIKRKNFIDLVEKTIVKVMSYNIGGFNYGVTPTGIADADYNAKIVKYRQFFGDTKADIVGIQELPLYAKRTGSNETESTTALFNNWYSYKQTNMPYMGLFSNIPISNQGFSTFTTGKTYDYFTVKIGDFSVYILNVHLTPDNATSRSTEIGEILALVADKEYFIITGDFNLNPVDEQATQYKRFTDEGYQLANTGWFGNWWTWSSDQTDFSNYDNPSGTVWYIDNIIISSNLHFKNVYCPNVYAQLTSDHIPCVAEISLY